MEWVEDESFGFGRPAFANELGGGEALDGLQSSPEVVGVDEVGQMLRELVMVVVVEALDGRVLDRLVLALDLAVGPGVLRFGRAVLDAQRGAGIFEGVRPDGFALGERIGNQLRC